MNRILNIFALLASGLAIGWMMGMSVSPVVQTVLTSVLAVIFSILSLLAGIPAKSENPPKESKSQSGNPHIETHVFGNIVAVLVENKQAPTGSIVVGETKEATPAAIPDSRQSFSLWPVSFFIVSMVLGAAGGIFTRTNDLLGPQPAVMAWRWGVTQEDSLAIARGMIASFIASTTQVTAATNQHSAVLFSEIKPTQGFCKRTKYANGGVLKTLIERLVVDKRASRHSSDEKRALDSLQRLLDSGPTDSTLKQIRKELCKNNATGL